MNYHESIAEFHMHQFDIYEIKSNGPSSLFMIHFRGCNWMQGGGKFDEYLVVHKRKHFIVYVDIFRLTN